MSDDQMILSPEQRATVCESPQKTIQFIKRLTLIYEIITTLFLLVLAGVIINSIYRGVCVPTWVVTLIMIMVILKLVYMWALTPRILSNEALIIQRECAEGSEAHRET